MPELPEVETLRADLEREVRGRRFVSVEVAEHRMTRGQSATLITERLQGQRVEAVARRGKYLLIRLGSGHTLLIHRGMSGNLLLEEPPEPIRPHSRLAARLDDGRRLCLVDPRGFGELRVLGPAELAGRLAGLGPEPLGPDFSPTYLARRLAGRTAPIKALLLDQRLVAGLGNIYSDESLWTARLHPLQPGGALDASRLHRLHAAVVDVLTQAIEGRGTTFASALDLYGREGDHAAQLRVFHRQACPACGEAVQRVSVAGRTSSFCPACQPLAPSDRGLGADGMSAQ